MGEAVGSMAVVSNSLVARNGVRERMATWNWKSGTMMYPSKREVVLVEAWCRTFNYVECVRILEAEGLGGISYSTVRRWLGGVRVQDWKNMRLIEKAKAEGYSKDHWKAVGVDMEEGKKVSPFQFMAWKEMGKACGYYDTSGIGINNKVEINFVERA